MIFSRHAKSDLLRWAKQKEPKPLLIRGARQVGKTSLVRSFGQANFTHLIELNLDDRDVLRPFKNREEDDISLTEFNGILRTYFKQKLHPGKTILFIDEIQNAPELIHLLRFFYEKMPGLHVIATGSHLELKIKREGLGLPVGRVQNLYLYPLDFFEYLEAIGEKQLLEELNESSWLKPPSNILHSTASALFRDYMMRGGMPEMLKQHIEGVDPQQEAASYASLLSGYQEDVLKYVGLHQAKYLNHIIDFAPLEAGTLFRYEGFGGSSYRSREMSEGFRLLEQAMLLTQVVATKTTEVPWIGQQMRPKKLIFLDVGLVNARSNLMNAYLDPRDLNQIYRGRIAEQVVGQQLMAFGNLARTELHYWAKDQSEGIAEVDFCYAVDGRPVGVEVKAGTTGQLKSLLEFGKLVKNAFLIRIYSGIMQIEKKVGKEKTLHVHSLPFYLLPALTNLIKTA